MVTILRDAGLSGLIESEAVERLAGGFQFTEGPLWQPDGSLLFQDIKAERTYRLDPDRSVQSAPRTHRSRQRPDVRPGRLASSFANRTAGGFRGMASDDGQRRADRRDLVGRAAQQPQRCRLPVRRLDLFHRPGVRRRAGAAALHFQGVFALDPSRDGPGGAAAAGRRFREAQRPGVFARRANPLRLRHRPLSRPGVRRRADGSLRVGSSRVFARLDPGQPGGPDGMKVDSGRPGLRRRRAGGLGLRARRPPAGNPRRCPPARRTWPGATPTPAAWRSRPSTPCITFGSGSRASCRRHAMPRSCLSCP